MKRFALIAAVTTVLLAGIGYHFFFGFVTTHQIGERLTVISRQNVLFPIGANVVLYNDPSNALVVDTQLAPLAAATKSLIDALSVSPIKHVIVTHWHPDHSGGVGAFPTSAVYAHPNAARLLLGPHEGFGLTKPGSYHTFPARQTADVPNTSVATELELRLTNSTVRVAHYARAHTDGDLAVFFPNDNVVVLGDLVWPGTFPFVDVHNGGTVQGLEAALMGILQRTNSNYAYVPGHGSEPLSHEEMRSYLDMVRSSRNWVEQRAEEGLTLPQILRLKPPTRWLTWSSDLVPIATWIEMVYASRSRAD